MNLKNTDTQIVSTGISRTDVFYDKNFIEAAAKAVYSVCPKARSKKIILYAPTFRGRVAKAQTPDCLDIAAMKEALGDEYFLLLKHHPPKNWISTNYSVSVMYASPTIPH